MNPVIRLIVLRRIVLPDAPVLLEEFALKIISFSPFRLRNLLSVAGLVLALMLPGFAADASTADLSKFAGKFDLAKIVPGADRLGPEEGSPPSAAAYKGEELVGYVFLNSAVVNATGYSGKPIHIVVGLDTDGLITGARMVKHSEPIVLVGIPVKKVHDFIDKYVGLNVLDIATTGKDDRELDIVSGATVTIMIIDDTIVRAAIRVMRTRGIGGLKDASADKNRITYSVRKTLDEKLDWMTMLGDGSVRRRLISVADINAAFEGAGKTKAAARPEPGPDGDAFVDFYIANASIPSIAHSLLGDQEYKNMMAALKPGEQAILMAGSGRYSFKGSGYVRGGIFDRIQLIQGDYSVRFRAKTHKRLADFAADGAPHLTETGLFIIPTDSGFDPSLPWRIQLLVHRAIGPIKKEFLTFDVGYVTPPKYLEKHEPKVAAAAPSNAYDDPGNSTVIGDPLWMKIWISKISDIIFLGLGLTVLTAMFFFQDWLAKRPVLTDRLRLAFLTYTVLWIGFYAQAQLSIVNVLTFAGSLMHGFHWDFFLLEPLIFILWGSVAASLLFWGRGVYCGWLCPFGALQELLNRIAKFFKIPQITVPWALHERAWPLKYLIFLGLFGVSLESFELAEHLAEIEPFKTTIILMFQRSWPFVFFAVGILLVGLFIERFFCRYICPLGGALGIPGRLRMNEWLRRHRECGNPCQRCSRECMVQAIHPDGHINPNECLQCLHCQTLYYDDQKCPPMIQKRLKRERRLALSSASMKSGKV
jgi:NosR/NirI family transcriptional regulator, nitrous oxide reductase regulator